MNNLKMEQRIKGSLYAFAIGDALGASTEFMTRDMIKKEYGKVDQIIGGGWLNLKAGQVTDDTEMMLLVGNAFFTKGNIDVKLNQCCKNMVSWYNTMPADIGIATAMSIVENMHRLDWSMWKRSPMLTEEPLGNGAVMRSLVPILCDSKTFAVFQGKLTHDSHESQQAVRAYMKAFKTFKQMSKLTMGKGMKYAPEPAGKAWESVSNAVYWSASTSTLEAAIIGAVNDGGDADTVAALTGGLVGFKYGFDAIPIKWLSDLDSIVHYELNEMSKKITKNINMLFTNI